MMVVWVAWHRLTILGGGAVWGGTGMGLGKRAEMNMQERILKKCHNLNYVAKIHNMSVINHQKKKRLRTLQLTIDQMT